MTTQSMPISRTRKDYIQSTIAVILIAAFSALGVYFTHPDKLRRNAEINFLGIDIPNLQGIVMRQPRMTIVISVSLIMFVSAFIFITREALPYFSRSIGWASVLVSGSALLALGYFNSDGTEGGWFRFVLLCLCACLFFTLLAEAMIFYRRFFHDKDFRFALWHRILFALVVAIIVAAAGTSYYHFAVENGAILDYGVTQPIPEVPQNNTPNPALTVPTNTAPSSNPLQSTTTPGETTPSTTP